MEYNKIVNLVSSIFDTTRGAFYRPLDRRIKDILYIAKECDLGNAVQYKSYTKISGVDIILVKEVPTKKLETIEVVYLDGDIVFIIFVDSLLDCKHIESLFNRILLVCNKFVKLICNRIGVDQNDTSIYSVTASKAGLVMTIKIMQSIITGFNQDDIPTIFNIYKSMNVKNEFTEFVDLCFKESTELLLEQCLIYEATLKLINIKITVTNEEISHGKNNSNKTSGIS